MVGSITPFSSICLTPASPQNRHELLERPVHDPGVGVDEQDPVGIDDLEAPVVGCREPMVLGLHEANVRELPTHQLGRVVGRAAVDDNDVELQVARHRTDAREAGR
jgi:hypothetical protein